MRHNLPLPVLFLAVLPLTLLTACSYEFQVLCKPVDAKIEVEGIVLPADGLAVPRVWSFPVSASRKGYKPYTSVVARKNLFGREILKIELEPESYGMLIDTIPAAASCRIDGSAAGTTPFQFSLSYGMHNIEFSAKGLPYQAFRYLAQAPGRMRFRLQKEPVSGMRPLGIYPCGNSPKQVTFTPDSAFLFISLLSGKGFDILDTGQGSLREIEVPGFGADEGFVEGIFPDGRDSFLLSQMSRNVIHEFSLLPGSDPQLKRSLPTGGVWPKVIAHNPVRDFLAVSNWVSNDVLVMEYRSGKTVKLLKGLGTPRGLAFSPDGSSLFVASYGDGRLSRFDTGSWERTGLIYRPGGAQRHLVLNGDGTKLFASDMARNEVLELDASAFTIIHIYLTGENPNTIDLSPDGRLLAVSCRGPNNPASYILRSPEPGLVMLFDTASKKLVGTIGGGAQPTGLDISPDGRVLAFSNFQDANVELFDIGDLLSR